MKKILLYINLIVVSVFLSSSAMLVAINGTENNVNFYIVIPSYNNERWCEKNLHSVFMQTYENWRLCYINDCSTDGTGLAVEQYIAQCGMSQKCHVIHNPQNKGAMANLYMGIHMADPREVVVIIDGDDALSDELVLQHLAQVYKKKHVWMTYGSYKTDPQGLMGICAPFPKKVLEKNSFRHYPWVASHLKTFYAKLFQRIKMKDLMIIGQFYPITYDQAITYPMLEMASMGHIAYIKRIMYLYNDTNPISDSKKNIFQHVTAEHIRAQRPYRPLRRLFSQKHLYRLSKRSKPQWRDPQN
jgi:glycosyltransferase involved in cell wall biosynthesis